MRVVVTGGAGYIGSHAVVGLQEAGHDVLIVVSFANAAEDVPQRIMAITGRQPEVARLDITDFEDLARTLSGFGPDAAIHFAGLKAVGESVYNRLEYYRVNVEGSVSLLRGLEKVGCHRLVFSSSATVCGAPAGNPNNLMPFVAQVAAGLQTHLQVFGDH